MGVHDRLEPVEIEKEKAQVRIRLLACLELDAELAVEKAVVAQAREIIAPRDLAVMIGIGEIQKRIRGVAREHLEQAQMPLRETFVVGPVEKTDDSAGGAFDQNRHREDGSRRVGRALVDRGVKMAVFLGVVDQSRSSLAKDPPRYPLAHRQAGAHDLVRPAPEDRHVEKIFICAGQADETDRAALRRDRLFCRREDVFEDLRQPWQVRPRGLHEPLFRPSRDQFPVNRAHRRVSRGGKHGGGLARVFFIRRVAGRSQSTPSIEG